MFRPVQLKGKYPIAEKRDVVTYGYVGDLSELHPEMVLAIPFFANDAREIPTCVAYMPRTLIRATTRGFRCEPATLKKAVAASRRDYAQFFNDAGLQLVERPDWARMTLAGAP